MTAGSTTAGASGSDEPEFIMWGALTARRGARSVDLGPARQRCVLAALLMSPGQAVAVDTLAQYVWGAARPSRARNVLATYASRLRRALKHLGGVSLRYRTGGYLVECQPCQVDLHRARLLVRTAREHAAAGRDEQADRLFGEALELCTGVPLAGLDGAWATGTRERLESERRAVLMDRIEVELRLGRHDALLPTLSSLVQQTPTDSRLVGWLMLALYRSGRRHDALAAYREARRASVDELGLDPGMRLQRLERAILRDDPAIDWTGTDVSAAPVRPSWPRPAQTPPAIADFVGRDDVLAAVVDAISPEHTRGARPVVVTGIPGVGKTALVVRAAHRLRPDFPDGQLFADLAVTAAQPADPNDILARFLRTLGVATTALPGDPDERRALYRSLLADRRILVVLDDAHDEAQVRPLLPTGPGCAVLITSRQRLSGIEAAVVVHLGMLSPAESVELLGATCGPRRLADDPVSAADVGELCGFLPLALRVAGARLASLPDMPLAAFAAELADERRRLDLLEAGDLHVRASLEVSYQRLTTPARRLLRRLGLLPAPDFTVRLAAVVLDAKLATTERACDELRTASLAEPAGVDRAGQLRYRLHDLIRIFARERAETEEPVRARRSAVRRAIHGWVAATEALAAGTAESGFMLIHEHPPCPPPRGAALNPPGAIATAWLEAELPALVGAVELAAREGMAQPAWHLAGSLIDFFDLRGHLSEWERTHNAALAAATRAGDAVGTAVIVQGLGFLEMARDRYEQALVHLERAAALFGSAGVPVGEADGAASTAVCHRMLGRLDDAAACAERADRLATAAGYLLGRAHARYELGVVRREQGRLAEAVECMEYALSLAREGGYPRAEGIILRGLGMVHARLGDGDSSIAYFEQARAALIAVGDELRAAYAAHQLAEAHLHRGRPAQAAPLLRHCLEVFQAQEDRLGTALGLGTQAKLHRQIGRLELATDGLRAVAEMWSRLGMPLWEARALRDLGDLYAEIGVAGTAAASWQRALAIMRRLRVPEAEELSARLAATDGQR